MKRSTAPLFPAAVLAALLLAPPVHAQAAADTGRAEIAELARVNGEALACQDLASARRAKALMLAHAPKTAGYGSVFDDGTQQHFLAVTRGQAACPDPAAQPARLDALARRLQAVLPAPVPLPIPASESAR
jgi:hypothetical protein